VGVAALLTAFVACSAEDSGAPDVTSVLPSVVPEQFDFVTYSTPEELADASSVVMTATVTSLKDLGTPDAGEDPNPSQYIAIVFEPDEILKGDDVKSVTIAWEAFITEAGKPIAEVVTEGFRLPKVGDRALLFLEEESEARSRHFGGVTTHALPTFDGFSLVEGNEVVQVRTTPETAAADLLGQTTAQVASAIAG
jgi:hypothetical protein